MNIKLNLKPGQIGRLVAEPKVAIDADSIEWKSYSQVVVMDQSRQKTSLDMAVIAGATAGIGIVEWNALTQDGNEVLSQIFEVEVAQELPEEPVTGCAYVSRETLENPTPVETPPIADPVDPVPPFEPGTAEDTDLMAGAQEDAAGETEAPAVPETGSTVGIDTTTDVLPPVEETPVPEVVAETPADPVVEEAPAEVPAAPVTPTEEVPTAPETPEVASEPAIETPSAASPEAEVAAAEPDDRQVAAAIGSEPFKGEASAVKEAVEGDPFRDSAPVEPPHTPGF